MEGFRPGVFNDIENRKIESLNQVRVTGLEGILKHLRHGLGNYCFDLTVYVGRTGMDDLGNFSPHHNSKVNKIGWDLVTGVP